MCKFIMMIGIPGSGKSTLAEKIAKNENAIVISSDNLREELFGDVWEFEKNNLLFSEMLQRTHTYLSRGENVIFDATNIRRSQRKQILKQFKPYFKECYYLKVPLEKVLRQNLMRNRHVPEEIIVRMYNQIQEPELIEGWDKVNIIDNH